MPDCWDPTCFDCPDTLARKLRSMAFLFAGAVYGEYRGTPAGILIDESRHASMVVVGSRVRGGFAGLLLGSVSSTVKDRAGCPFSSFTGAAGSRG